MKLPSKQIMLVVILGIAGVGNYWGGWSNSEVALYIITMVIIQIYWRQK